MAQRAKDKGRTTPRLRRLTVAEMPTDRPATDGSSSPMDSRSLSAITNAPATRLNGRTAVGRRVRDLFKALAERLGSPADIVTQADILALAELKTAAEVARARLLEGGGGADRDSNNLVRLENLVRRAEARLGLVPNAGQSEPTDIRALLGARGYEPPADDDELPDEDSLEEEEA